MRSNGVKAVKNGAVRRIVVCVRQGVVHLADRCGGDEVPPVGIGLPQHRAEVTVRDREPTRQRIIKGLVSAVPVAHRDRAARRLHETVVAAVVELDVTGGPLLAGLTRKLAGRWHVKRVLEVAVGVRVDRHRDTVAQLEAVSARPVQHAELVVIGVVLHHQHDDVFDLRHGVGALR